MKDPKRLTSDQPTEIERLLLRAAAQERPSPQQRLRVRRAIGLRGWWTLPAFLGLATNRIAKAALLVLIGILGIGSISMGALAVRRCARNRSVAMDSSRAPLVRSAEARSVSPNSVAWGPSAPGSSAPFAGDAGAPLVLLPAKISTSRVATHVSSDTTSGLREEIRLVDQARSALDQHDAKAALRSLDLYTAKFASGALAQEASVLVIEALDYEGDHARAASLAKSFLAHHPSSAHVARVQRITAY